MSNKNTQLQLPIDGLFILDFSADLDSNGKRFTESLQWTKQTINYESDAYFWYDVLPVLCKEHNIDEEQLKFILSLCNWYDMIRISDLEYKAPERMRCEVLVEDGIETLTYYNLSGMELDNLIELYKYFDSSTDDGTTLQVWLKT